MKPAKILLLIAAVWSGLNSASAQTWTLTSAPSTNWISVASSADGSRLIAVGEYWLYCISTNSGASWTTNAEPQKGSTYGSWVSVASSADGTEFAGVNGNEIWVSTNSGATWSSNTVPNVSIFNSVAISADGSKLVAVSGEYGPPSGIYTSTNSGVTWTQTMAPTNYWISVASSADGSKLIAAVFSINATTNGNVIYISTNSGASWFLSGAPTNIPWSSVASSADGSKLVAASEGAEVPDSGLILGSIYTSTNSGMNWISNNLPSALWQAVASSADGSKLMAMAQSKPIYTSTNSGVTWTSNNVASQGWYSVASSADGNKLVAASFYGIGDALGNIYTLQTTPSPQLNIAPLSNNFALSWIIPSTNFVLQQSSDLASWVDVTNTPALNLTNLQNKVTLSPSNSSGFYRLKTP